MLNIHDLLTSSGLYFTLISVYDLFCFSNCSFISDHKHNFNKYNSSTVTDYGVGYDYNSIMHYSSHAFSKNEKETLTPKVSETLKHFI